MRILSTMVERHVTSQGFGACEIGELTLTASLLEFGFQAGQLDKHDAKHILEPRKHINIVF